MAPPAAARNFQQHQPITTALRQICESYSAGTCLRELLQNADDAEATEIEYVLDTKTYTDGPLLYDSLQDFQGPALLARNNKTFSDKDFASLASIGDSRKRHDAAATGKFGQGFNSCYHWTDGPWIYSRNWLLLLDPHENWSIPTGQPGGPTWDVIKNKNSEELQNHLKTFGAFPIDTAVPLDATIIRIPLRTQAQAVDSKIVKKEVTVENIKDALILLGREVRQGGLLFLKHVRKMVVRVDDQIMWEAQIEEVTPTQQSVRQELTADFRALFVDEGSTTGSASITKRFTLNMIYKEGSASISTPYLLQHSMLKSSGNEDLDAWARSKKLFPWVAIGAPLNRSFHDEPFNGRLFSILRMPLETSQPVHIHGLFSITPDRGRLSSSGQTPGYEDMEVKWNTFMFEHCVAGAWASLLEYRNGISWKEEEFSLWPRVEPAPTELWTRLDGYLLRQVLSKNLKVWNTPHSCITASEGMFSSLVSEVSTIYAEALACIHLPVVYLDTLFLDKATEFAARYAKPLRSVTPEAVRSYLRSRSMVFPKNISNLVLEYCLYDMLDSGPFQSGARKSIYGDLSTIALWPTVDGNLRSLAGGLILPRDSEERALFASARANVTICIEKLTSRVFSTIKRDNTLGMLEYVQLRKMADLALDWPLIYPNPDKLSTHTQPRRIEQDALLGQAWRWIELRFQDEKILAANLRNLWLLPVAKSHIRQCMPGPGSRPLLIIEGSDELYQTMGLGAVTEQEAAIDAQILQAQLLPATAVKLLRQQVAQYPDLCAASSDDLVSLARWLAANATIVSNMSEAQKEGLLQELDRLTHRTWMITPNLMSNTQPQEVSRHLKRLPLFSQQFAEVTSSAWITKKSEIGHNFIATQLPPGLPPVLLPDGVSFFATLGVSDKFLIDTFKLLKIIDLETLMFKHILPNVLDTQAGCREQLIASLANFILDKSLSPSESWIRQLKSFPIIPIRKLDNECTQQFRRLDDLVEPKSTLAKLYFESENVFPQEQFFRRHPRALVVCGLRRDVNCETIIERARFYTSCKNPDSLLEKVRKLLGISLDISSGPVRSRLAEVTKLSWLPVQVNRQQSLTLLPPHQCRGVDQANLVDCVLGVLNARITKAWKDLFGWNRNIDIQVLVEQLDTCLREKRYEQVDAVCEYIHANHDSKILRLKKCILSRKREYIYPHEAFLPGSILDIFSLSPYREETDQVYADKHMDLLLSLEISSQPSLADIIEVQKLIFDASGGVLDDDAQLGVVINSLEIASRLYRDDDFAQLKAPDIRKKLLPIHDLVHGDRTIGVNNQEFMFVHPALSTRLVEKLGIESITDRIIRLEIEIDDEDDDEYVPSERLTTIIQDTLRRYPELSTFSEFLANAEDCQATAISWILDRCENEGYRSESLLTSEISSLQGASLFAFNDKTFTAEDFDGYKDIGRGGKTGNIESIGLFGRGSMSMYHFTDSPMILSGKWLLLLDPYQLLLPRNRRGKRKPGVKIALDKVRQRFNDQLHPFEGLCGFSQELDHFQGTLFRMPLKGASKLDKAIKAEHINQLFKEYFPIARDSLLFLKHVHSIQYTIRGQASYGWSVNASRPEDAALEIFHQMKLRGSYNGEPVINESWRIGQMELDRAPASISNPLVSKLKVTECGVAARLPEQEVASRRLERERMDPMFYNKLPTTYPTMMPVALHATFAVTGDRRSISIDDERDPATGWNRWLLQSCIPELYIEFIKDLAPRLGPASFDFWPSKTLGGVAGVVQKSFWEKLFDNQFVLYPLYPVVEDTQPRSHTTTLVSRSSGRKKINAVMPLSSAEFDFLTDKVSDDLRPLFTRVCPGLVRPPSHFKRRLVTESGRDVKSLDLTYLSQLFKNEENCRHLQDWIAELSDDGPKSKLGMLETLLLEMIPKIYGEDKTALHVLDGCRIMPKLDGSLTALRLNLASNPLGMDDWILSPSRDELALFGFASEKFVEPTLFAQLKAGQPSISILGTGFQRNVIQELQSVDFNIRPLHPQDIGKLVIHAKSPLVNPRKTPPEDKWFSRLWTYLNRRVTACEKAEQVSGSIISDFVTTFGLQHCHIYRVRSGAEWQYLTPNGLEAQAFVIEPDKPEHVRLCNEIEGLQVIERIHVRTSWASEERNFDNDQALARLLSALEKIEVSSGKSITAIIEIGLSAESIQALQNLILQSSGTSNHVRNRPIVQKLPLWPLPGRTSSNGLGCFLQANNAVFCKHSSMLLPWTKGLNRFVDPDFVARNEQALTALGMKIPSVGTLWKERIEGYLPEKIQGPLLLQYHAMVTCLAMNNVQTTAKLVPNGNGVLCLVSSLYDEQEEIFNAAFRLPEQQNIKFAHTSFRNLRQYWKELGLRVPVSGDVSPDDYLDCVKAIDVRTKQSPVDQHFGPDAEKVSSYLVYNKPWFQTWSGNYWSQISRVKMFRVEDNLAPVRGYRRPRVQALAQRSAYCSLRESANRKHRRILWSQRPFLRDPPDGFVYAQIPECQPSVKAVYLHLLNLMVILVEIDALDVVEFLKDVQACYEFLQNNIDKTKSIQGIRQADIWLNLDTNDFDTVTTEQLKDSVTKAERLCINSVAEPYGYRNTLRFLNPYEKLLKAIGVQALLIRKDETHNKDEGKGSSLEDIAKGYQDLRKLGELFDVIFEAENAQHVKQRISAHKVTMASISPHLRTHFSEKWNSRLAEDRNVIAVEMKFATISHVIDYAYNGTISWTPLPRKPTNDEIADSLDELLDLLQASDMWDIKRLHRMTEQILLKDFDTYVRPDNVLNVIDRAREVRAPQVEKRCGWMIEDNPDFVNAFRD